MKNYLYLSIIIVILLSIYGFYYGWYFAIDLIPEILKFLVPAVISIFLLDKIKFQRERRENLIHDILFDMNEATDGGNPSPLTKRFNSIAIIHNDDKEIMTRLRELKYKFANNVGHQSERQSDLIGLVQLIAKKSDIYLCREDIEVQLKPAKRND